MIGSIILVVILCSCPDSTLRAGQTAKISLSLRQLLSCMNILLWKCIQWQSQILTVVSFQVHVAGLDLAVGMGRFLLIRFEIISRR